MRCSEGKLIFELSRSLLLSLRRSASVPVYLVVLPLLLRANSPVEQRQFSGYRISRRVPVAVLCTGTHAPEPIRASALRLLAVRIRSNILSHPI